MPRAVHTPPEPPPAVADVTGLADAPEPPESPEPPDPPPACPEAAGWALDPAAPFGGTSSPTGSTLPAALKPQSKSLAVSL